MSATQVVSTTTDPDGNQIYSLSLTPSLLHLEFQAVVDGIATTAISDHFYESFEPLSPKMANVLALRLLADFAAAAESQQAITARHLESLAGDYKQGLIHRRLDDPGCDYFPDTCWTLGSCRDHDICFQKQNCTAASWARFICEAIVVVPPPFVYTGPISVVLIPIATISCAIAQSISDACKNCNDIVVGCTLRACTGINDPETSKICYDNKCNTQYDCDPDPNDPKRCYCDCRGDNGEACAPARAPTPAPTPAPSPACQLGYYLTPDKNTCTACTKLVVNCASSSVGCFEDTDVKTCEECQSGYYLTPDKNTWWICCGGFSRVRGDVVDVGVI